MTIEIHDGPNGKPVALQKIGRFYAKMKPQAGGELRALELDPAVDAGFVDHFETCPEAPAK